MSAQTAAQLNYAKTGQQFSTVSIPDLRSQQIEVVREGSRIGVPPVATSDVERLATIQDEINQSYRESGATPAISTAAIPTSAPTTKENWLGSLPVDRQPQLEPLIGSILEHYPVGGTPIIALAATEENPQLAATVAQATIMLQAEVEGRILIIDSDYDNGGLTYHMEFVGQPGLVEMIGGQHEWNECVHRTQISQVDFMPIGRSALRNTDNTSQWIGRALPHFRKHYEYVMVCAGEAHTKHSSIWCSQSSGSYLLVSMESSNQAIAKSAVTHLKAHGARILGCIATDSR